MPTGWHGSSSRAKPRSWAHPHSVSQLIPEPSRLTTGYRSRIGRTGCARSRRLPGGCHCDSCLQSSQFPPCRAAWQPAQAGAGRPRWRPATKLGIPPGVSERPKTKVLLVRSSFVSLPPGVPQWKKALKTWSIHHWGTYLGVKTTQEEFHATADGGSCQSAAVGRAEPVVSRPAA